MNLRGLVKGLEDLHRSRQAQLLLLMQGEAAAEPLIEFLLGPPSLHAEPRCLAAEALAIIGGDRAVEGLIQALTVNDVSDADPAIQLAEEAVRNWIAEQLGRLGDRRAIPGLLDALRRYHLPNAATALARFGVAEAIPEIVNLLEDEVIRSRLVDALRVFGRAAIPCLVEALLRRRYFGLEEHPASVRRRACAARLLGEFEDSAASAALPGLLTDDAEPVRFEAALALLMREAPEEHERAARLLAILFSALDGANFEAIIRCQDALGAAGPGVLTLLGQALATGTVQQPDSVDAPLSDEARLVLIDCLARLGDPQAADILTALLKASDPRIQGKARWVLKQLSKEVSEAHGA